MSLITKELILFNCGASYRDEAIKKMADLMDANNKLSDKTKYLEDVFIRENESSTAVGYSIAVPHAKSIGVKEECVGFIKFNTPIQWDTNSKPVSMIFQIAVPDGEGNRHLEILGSIFRALLRDDFRKKLSSASTEEEICKLIESI